MIGILTYHAAYNYGSVFQAYATQQVVESIGYQCSIINYRMVEQKNYYKLYRTSYGIKTLIKDLGQIPEHKNRICRSKKFETFINTRMHLTEEFTNPDEVYAYWLKFDAIISGSDQIWNKHSCELHNNNWEYMYPYLLRGYDKTKISYASSFGNMTDEDILRILPDIKVFDSIAMRERSSAKKLEELLARKVTTVLDPTLLLDSEQWVRNFKLSKKNCRPYILYYSLSGAKPQKRNIDALREIAEKCNLTVRVITPYVNIPLLGHKFENCAGYGPEDFLEAIFNADMIVTDSYHGTILSLNLGKNVFSLCQKGGSEFRKTDILDNLGMNERIIYDIEDLIDKKFDPINYHNVRERIGQLRRQSIEYLRLAIEK